MNYDIAYYGGNISDRVLGMRRRLDSCGTPLIVMSPCGDKYWDKKTIYNVLGVLSLDGILCIVADFNNIGAIIAIMKECNLNYNICSFFATKLDKVSTVEPQLLVCVSKQGKQSFCPTLIMDNEPLAEMLLRSSAPQDTILVIGDKLYQVAMVAKRTCRHVVCFLENYSEFLENEGITMEEIRSAS